MDALAAALRPLHFRGKERLAHIVTPTSGKRSAVIFGSRFELDLSDFIQRNLYAGTYERAESRLVRDILRSGMTFVDVGANVGFYTALAAEAIRPNGTVLAFEPSEYAFPRLQEMIERNNLTGVRAIKCGLADVPGERTLYGGVELDFNNNHTATMVPNGNPNRNTVEIDTLDRVAERFGIRMVDFLKIDVDGFELPVLRGAAKLLSEARIAHILLECSEEWFQRMNTSTVEVLSFLESKGFKKGCRIGKSDNYFFSLQSCIRIRARLQSI